MSLKWLIYCRVSSTKQVKEWNGLSSQEQKCMSYAQNVLWIEVERVFNDEWISWWIFERKSIKELINYIDTHKNNSYTVIFEDLNRLSRDIQVHHLLRAEFRKRWVELQCPNFQFEESPEWTFRENMSVSMAQYEKEKNRQRVLSRQKSRLEQWFYCFSLPLWYKYIENKEWWWKIVIEDKKYSKIVKQALEKYASNELKTINDVARFLYKKWLKIGTIKKWKVYNSNSAYRMLNNILYTWYLELSSWWIGLTKAKHNAIISMETYNIIQKKLKSNSKTIENKVDENIIRADISEDFPLRWFLYCEESKYMLSSGWTKWRTTKVPYYTYPRNSPMKGKSINRENIHNEFFELLKQLTPNENLLDCFEKIFLDLSKNRKNIFEEQEQKNKKYIKDIEIKINNYIERIWNTNNNKLIDNYELKIEELEKEKEILSKKIDENYNHLKNVWTSIKDKLKIAWNALLIWNTHSLEKKKELLKMMFPSGIPINKKRGVWTPNLSLIYQAFEHWKVSKSYMVDRAGFEPATLSLRGICSTSWAISPKKLV